MEQKSLKVMSVNNNFFNRLTTTLTKLLIPTKIGFNSIVVTMKRNNVIKAYENFISTTDELDKSKRENSIKKYEEAYTSYLESIDKYVMDSIYKKVKSGTASNFEKNVLSNYYTVSSLKETQYMEYKNRKQKYLLDIDYKNLLSEGKEKVIERYKDFYISKEDSLYKGILKNYSIQISDTSNRYISKDSVYDKIFKTLEDYITNILPIKMKKDSTNTYKEIVDDYDKFAKFIVGKLDEIEQTEKNMILLGISRHLFTHSLPLIVAEQCYQKLIQDIRELIVEDRMKNKQEKSYDMLITLIEDYNIKLLSTKIYWENQKQREEYKNFWEKYKAISNIKEKNFLEYKRKKEILFIRNELKNIDQNKNTKLVKFYKEKLTEYGDIRNLKNLAKSLNGVYKKV